MQDKIIAAIAAYLEKETIHDYISEHECVKFGGVINTAHFTHAGFCQEIAAEIAAAIAPLVEEGEPRFYNPTEHPTRVEGEDFSVDVFILDEDCVHGIAFWNFDDEVWRFHTDTLVDYNEKGAETKWKWYYPPFELSEVFKAK